MRSLGVRCCSSPARKRKRVFVVCISVACFILSSTFLVMMGTARKSSNAQKVLIRGRVDLFTPEAQTGSKQTPPISTSDHRALWSDEPRVGLPTTTQAPTCTPKHQIVFIKTHKTGSSTITTLIQRYGFRRGLNFALPGRGHFFSRKVFDSKSVYQKDLKSKNGTLIWPALGGFNLLVNHARYNRPVQEKLIPGAVFFSIIRNPVAQFESAFGYFPEFVREVEHNASDDPLKVFVGGLPGTYNAMESVVKAFLRNGQIFDLGVEPELFNDSAAVSEAIASLSRGMDLVMINEYFDESLLLLKKLLCWEFQDIVYISKGVRKAYAHRNITNDMKAKIVQWNHVDVKLYQHFNQTFWEKIRNYGPNFKQDLDKFRELNAAVGGKCMENATESISGHKTSVFKFKGNSSELCQDLVRYDITWVSLIKRHMQTKSDSFRAKLDGASVTSAPAPQAVDNGQGSKPTGKPK